MTRVSLHAALVGIGLGLAGATQDVHAGGHFHHHKNTMSFETVGVTQMAMPAVGVTQMAMPVVGVTQMAMPTAAFAPMAMAVPTAAFAPMAMATTPRFALMAPASGQAQQAPSLEAFPQVGISDVTAILDLLSRLRGTLSARNGGGSGVIVNPGTGGNGPTGSCPEVRITISGGGATTVTGGAGANAGATEGTAQNTDLETAINQLAQARVQQMLSQATARASAQAPAAAQLAPPPPQPGDDKEAQLRAILDELEALKAKVNALK